MANISSLSSSTNSAMSSLRGYGGLSSGLDRDELIEGMTSGTQTKITKQQQAKTKLQWQQEAYRNISDKMIAFANKYTATMSSSTNLFSDALWGAASTSVVGANSKYISVTGANKTAAANVSILGVKQLATNTKMMSGNAVSDRTLSTGTIKMGNQDVSTVAGKNLQFTVGDDNYYVSLPYGDVDKGNYDSIESVAQALKEAMDKIEVKYDNSKTGKLSDFVEVGVKDGNLTLAKKGRNSVSLKGGTALEALGFKAQVDATKEGSTVKGLELEAEAKVGFKDETEADGTTAKKFAAWESQSFAQRMGGKNLTFNYNGNRQSIELPTQEEIQAAQDASQDGLKFLANNLQKSLDAVYGKGRVTVEAIEGQLKFKTTTPDGKQDDSSTLSIVDGSASLMAAKGGMGIIAGESNRLNLNTSLKNSGLASLNSNATTDGKYTLNVNGTNIEFTDADSLSTIMDRINNANAGVKISYMSTADKFVVEATDGGASGVVQLSGNGAKALFGEEIDSEKETANGAQNAVSKGQDAIVAVKYAGSDEAVELTRGSNSFSIDGLNVTAKGVFGYKEKVDDTGNVIKDKNGKAELELDKTAEAVTFETNVSSDKMVSAISDMVKEYNEILELVNSQVSTRPDSDYFPLTDEQKKEMSESEIKLWEEKAKAGVLFGSSELRSLSEDLRWMIDPKDQQYMAELGISVSNNWQDNGKLVFDETKFKAALEQDPDAVKAAFTGENGIATNLKNTMNKYVSTMGATKGILIEKAGSTHAPTSVLKNSIQSEIDDVDKILENLKARLKSEQDRYINQFTQLETLISQMNSQSSYLSGMGF